MEDSADSSFPLVPTSAASSVLHLVTEQMKLTVTCTPYRPGDFSGELGDGTFSLHLDESDGSRSSFEAHHLIGEWSHAPSPTPGRLHQLRLELRGNRDTGEPVNIILEGLELLAEKMPASSDEPYSGHLVEGLLVIPGQLQLSLSEDGLFTLLPQSS